MKNNKISWCLIMLSVLVFVSCEYQEYADTNYTEQKIYLPIAALDEFYTIETVPTPTVAVPTPGTTSRFKVDVEENKFIVPLSVFRSGITNKGKVSVDIKANTDTINQLIALDLLKDTELLPADKYSLDSSVDVQDGKDIASFNLTLDLQFLRQNAPSKKYAIGVSISSKDRKATEQYATAIIVVDTKIMIPSIDFKFQNDLSNWSRITFSNISDYAMSSSWTFGDEKSSAEINPVHFYNKTGFYQVTLKIKGVAGDELTKTLEVPVLEILKLDKSKWNILDFSSEQPLPSAAYPDQGKILSILDNDVDTYWSSTSEAYPHWFVVDLGEEYIVRRIESYKRQGNKTGQTEYQIEISIDGTNWTDFGLHPLDQENDNGQSIELDYPLAKYVRYSATKGGQRIFLAEFNVYASVKI